MSKPKFVAVDFDGTVVTHEFPKIGRDIGAVPWLRRLVDEGHKIILYTMRSGKTLDDAVAWFCENDIPLHAINQNPSQAVWTQSPKVYAHFYVDDAAIGIPLVQQSLLDRPHVNWELTGPLLFSRLNFS